MGAVGGDSFIHPPGDLQSLPQSPSSSSSTGHTTKRLAKEDADGANDSLSIGLNLTSKVAEPLILTVSEPEDPRESTGTLHDHSFKGDSIPEDKDAPKHKILPDSDIHENYFSGELESEVKDSEEVSPSSTPLFSLDKKETKGVRARVWKAFTDVFPGLRSRVVAPLVPMKHIEQLARLQTEQQTLTTILSGLTEQHTGLTKDYAGIEREGTEGTSPPEQVSKLKKRNLARQARVSQQIATANDLLMKIGRKIRKGDVSEIHTIQEEVAFLGSHLQHEQGVPLRTTPSKYRAGEIVGSAQGTVCFKVLREKRFGVEPGLEAVAEWRSEHRERIKNADDLLHQEAMNFINTMQQVTGDALTTLESSNPLDLVAFFDRLPPVMQKQFIVDRGGADAAKNVENLDMRLLDPLDKKKWETTVAGVRKGLGDPTSTIYTQALSGRATAAENPVPLKDYLGHLVGNLEPSTKSVGETALTHVPPTSLKLIVAHLKTIDPEFTEIHFIKPDVENPSWSEDSLLRGINTRGSEYERAALNYLKLKDPDFDYSKKTIDPGTKKPIPLSKQIKERSAILKGSDELFTGVKSHVFNNCTAVVIPEHRALKLVKKQLSVLPKALCALVPARLERFLVKKYQKATAQTPREKNFGVVTEVLASQVWGKLGFNVCSERVIHSAYGNGPPKLLIDSREIRGKEGGKFSELTGKINNGMIPGNQLPDPDESSPTYGNMFPVEPKSLARVASVMGLTGDRDAGKEGNLGYYLENVTNPETGEVQKMAVLVAFDFGKSLPLKTPGKTDTMTAVDFLKDGLIHFEGNWRDKRSGAFKNSEMSGDTLLSERLQVARNLESALPEITKLFDEEIAKYPGDAGDPLGFADELGKIKDRFITNANRFLKVHEDQLKIADDRLVDFGDNLSKLCSETTAEHTGASQKDKTGKKTTPKIPLQHLRKVGTPVEFTPSFEKEPASLMHKGPGAAKAYEQLIKEVSLKNKQFITLKGDTLTISLPNEEVRKEQILKAIESISVGFIAKFRPAAFTYEGANAKEMHQKLDSYLQKIGSKESVDSFAKLEGNILTISLPKDKAAESALLRLFSEENIASFKSQGPPTLKGVANRLNAFLSSGTGEALSKEGFDVSRSKSSFIRYIGSDTWEQFDKLLDFLDHTPGGEAIKPHIRIHAPPGGTGNAAISFGGDENTRRALLSVFSEENIAKYQKEFGNKSDPERVDNLKTRVALIGIKKNAQYADNIALLLQTKAGKKSLETYASKSYTRESLEFLDAFSQTKDLVAISRDYIGNAAPKPVNISDSQVAAIHAALKKNDSKALKEALDGAKREVFVLLGQSIHDSPDSKLPKEVFGDLWPPES